MRLVIWGGVGGYERCKTLWCMREHFRFLTEKNLPPLEECNVLLNCVGCWSLCTVTLCTLVECVSDIDSTHMNTYTYHYRMDGPHL